MTREALETAARLEAILESTVDGTLTIDERGVIESTNRAATAIFGYEREELLGSNVAMLMPLPYRDAHDGYLARYLAGGRAAIIGSGREVSGRHKDGTEFPLYLAVSESCIGDRRRFTGIIRDLSELRFTQERVKSAEELASLSVITAGIAHDIGTPMNVILGYADMLRDSLEDPKDRRRAEVISDQVRRVTDLLQTLLNIARPHKTRRSVVRIDEVLTHSLEFFREKLRARNIKVEHAPGSIASVLGDRDRLEQMFLNLIVNASDAMSDGGTLSACVDATQEGWVAVTIVDSGRGMDPKALERIFEPFYTSKDRGKGTGLGLVVCRSIVLDHQGSIDVESEVGEGTRFVLRFPSAKTSMS